MISKIKVIISKILKVGIIICSFCVSKVAFADIVGDVTNPLGGDATFESILSNAFTEISKFGAVLVAIMIVWSGFLFVTAAGNDERLKKAKSSLTYVIIGGAIVLGAWGLAELIKDTTTSISTMIDICGVYV